MITKFLYQLNENNKRILTGVVHDNVVKGYNPEDQYPMVLEDTFVKAENETVVYNYGAQFYVTFSDDDVIKYLNFNDYMLKVRLGVTDNVAFATILSKNVLAVILEETAYFNTDLDINYVDSGMSLTKNKEYKDLYDGWFRKVVDDVYVEFNHLRYPLFIGKENNEFILTEDFSKAFRVSKKECRPLLITREFIDKEMPKRNVCFSHYNIFLCEGGYAFGGYNSFEITYADDILKITRDFKMTSEHRLVSDETRAGVLKDICYLMKNKETESKGYLKINGKYLKFLGNGSYELSNEAATATPIDFNTMEILKKAICLFIDNPSFEVLTTKNYFVYEHLDSYELSKEIIEAIPSKLISRDTYERFIEAFSTNDDAKYIISINDKYVELELLSNLKFKLNYYKTGFSATRFTADQVKALSNVMGVTYNRRELIPIFNSSNIYNIKPTAKDYSLAEAYDAFADQLHKLNIRFSNSVIIKELKTESDKGAFEYLKRFYLKTLFDSYHIFKNMLADKDITNILLCGTTSTADIMGLSMAVRELDHEVNVVTLEIPKWGVYPLAFVNDKLNYEASYRLPLTALDKDMISRFDMIYIGKSFKENPEALKDYLATVSYLDKTIYVANLSLSGEYEIPNTFYRVASTFTQISRKYLNYDRTLLNTLDKTNESIIDKTSTYYSLLEFGNKEIKDLFPKVNK